MHNEIDSIIDPGVRKREVIAIDTVIDAVSGRVREIHDKPPLSRSSEFRDNTKSADMESRKRRPGKRTSDHAEVDFARQVLVLDLGILESGLHVLGRGLDPGDAGRVVANSKAWRKPDRRY